MNLRRVRLIVDTHAVNGVYLHIQETMPYAVLCKVDDGVCPQTDMPSDVVIDLSRDELREQLQ